MVHRELLQNVIDLDSTKNVRDLSKKELLDIKHAWSTLKHVLDSHDRKTFPNMELLDLAIELEGVEERNLKDSDVALIKGINLMIQNINKKHEQDT